MRRRLIHQRLTLLLQVLMIAGVVLALYERQWLNAFLTAGILILTLLPSLLGRRFKVYIPPDIEFATAVFIFAALFLGEIRGYYIRFWWWDVVLHTTSALLLGTLGFLLVYVLNAEENIGLYMKPGFVALFSFAFAVAIGALWEIFEYAMDSVFGLNMQKSGLVDTMWDLIVDALGAGVMALVGYFYLKRRTDSFLSRLVAGFIEQNRHLFDKKSS